MADGESRIENFLVAGVTRAMLLALTDLGVCWSLERNELTVFGCGDWRFDHPDKPINCGNSATTLRLLVGALAAADIPAVIDGSEGLRRRPMNRIIEPLRRMGVPISGSAAGTAPLVLEKRSVNNPLRGMEHRLPIPSAQVKSCILLAGLGGDGPTTVVEPGPSRDHTERMLRSMKVSITTQQSLLPGETSVQNKVTVYPHSPHQKIEQEYSTGMLSPLQIVVPGDFSSAAFLIVGALITPGADITIRNVGLNPTRTGLFDVLLEMGGQIEVTPIPERTVEPSGDIRVRYSRLHGVVVKGDDVVRMIDEFPAFAVAAALARGRTVVRDAAELRMKESDRIHALAEELTALGGRIDEFPDGFQITGVEVLEGGEVESHGDHRLAMSLALAGFSSRKPVTVRGAEIIAESYPEFTNALTSLGARVESVQDG
jgi:3-phosphoshikimate 1-carboxyvinyltransferase